MEFDSVYVSVLNAFEIVECSDKNISNVKNVFVRTKNNVLYRDDFTEIADTTNIRIVCNVKRSSKNFKITIVLCLLTDYLCRFW